MIISYTRRAVFVVLKSFIAAASILASGAIQLAVAQDDVDEALEEIVVVAERRATDVQDVPIAMTAFTGDQLEKKAVTRVEDLQYAAPSLSVTDAAITQSVNIRGIGLASGDPNATNGVGVYIDGLFQPPIVSTLSFYDLADVQVLRGPQGTFSGANSTGGALVVNSRRPEVGGDVSGYIQAGFGDYSDTNAQGAIGLPVGDTFAVRAAFNWRDRDSFYNDIGPANTNAGSLDETRVRLGFLWQPTEDFEIYAKYETSDLSTGGFPNRPMDTSDFAFARTDSIWDISYNTDTKHDESDDTMLIDAAYTFGNDVELRLLSGSQEKEIDIIWDFDSTSALSLEQTQLINEDQVSHEVTLVSPTGEGIEWVVGYYYQKNEIDVDIQTPGPRILIGIEKETRGLFGQVGFEVADNLQVEVGLRKVWFEAGGLPGSGGYFGPIEAGPAFPINGSYDDDDLVGKLSFNWTTDMGLVYASFAKGWKPGGYNNPNPADNFLPEEVSAYELGWKTDFLEGAVRTSAAVFYSDYDNFQFDNIDITSGSSGIKNVGKAKIKGAEFSVDALLGALRLDASIAYVNSDLSAASGVVDERALPASASDLPQCTGAAVPPDCFDYTPYLVDTMGGPNLFAPELSFSAGAEVTFDVLDGHGTLTPRLNYGWIDDQWVNLVYEDVDLLKSRGLLSAMVTLEADNWMVRFYGRNLADREYVRGQYLSMAAGGVEYYGAPREWGILVGYEF